MSVMQESIVALDQAPLGEALIIVSTPQDPIVAHKMMTLGWSKGGQVRVLKKTVGGARILDLNGSRVAISKALARTVCVEGIPG
ncbi:MAG: ferrous iron transport protein A [Propionibacteriaceae bacterium]|nr:ferrous iron transport protein A [Propionibacteriaceae bacterium]